MKHIKSIRNKIIFLIFVLTPIFMYAKRNIAIDSSAIIKIIPIHKNQFVLTESTLSLKRNNQTILLAKIEKVIHDAVFYKDTIWIGTANGLYSYSIKKNQIQYHTKLGSGLNISRLKMDKDGSLWIASLNDGLWEIKNNQTKKALDISPVYSLETADDSVIWAGTNIGLYKLNKHTNKWLRYAEEGYSGYELPDNIVEKLFGDLHDNLWVVMPDEFTFIANQPLEGHMQDFKNMFLQDFELKFIAEPVPHQYIFVTSKGFFLMSTAPILNKTGQQEIHEGVNQKMFFLSNKQLLLSEELDPISINSVSMDEENNLLIAFNNQLHRIKRKTMKQAIRSINKH